MGVGTLILTLPLTRCLVLSGPVLLAVCLDDLPTSIVSAVANRRQLDSFQRATGAGGGTHRDLSFHL